VFLDEPQAFNDVVLRLCGVTNPLPAPQLPEPQLHHVEVSEVEIQPALPVKAA
jgi:hypothetical protein